MPNYINEIFSLMGIIIGVIAFIIIAMIVCFFLLCSRVKEMNNTIHYFYQSYIKEQNKKQFEQNNTEKITSTPNIKA